MKVAYDLDGTLMNDLPKYKGISYFKLTKKQRKKRKEWKLRFFAQAKLILDPKEQRFDIITNRRSSFRKETEEWIKLRLGKRCRKLIMNSGASFFHKDTIEYKAKILNEGGYTKYYENNKRIYAELKKLCPGCKIILVKGGRIVKNNISLQG